MILEPADRLEGDAETAKPAATSLEQARRHAANGAARPAEHRMTLPEAERILAIRNEPRTMDEALDRYAATLTI